MLTKTQKVPWELTGERLTGLGIAIWWIYLNNSSIEWLFASLQESSIFNTILLGTAIATLSMLGFWHRHRICFSLAPKWEALPLSLMLGAGVGAIALRWFLDIPQLSVVLFLIGTYGLIGLFIDTQIWKPGLTVAILFACVFPFSLQISVGIGFPLRVMTAYVVEHLLTSWGLPAISSHDIIVLEGRIAYVDLPCSGLKSFWTGTIFLLAATWLENRKIGWRWLGVFLVNIILLIATNIERVTALVLINNVWQQPELARMIHFPLGLLGFGTACFLGWLLLRFVPQNQDSITNFNWRKIFYRDRLPFHPEKKSIAKDFTLLQKAGVSLLAIGLLLISHPSHLPSHIADIDSFKVSSGIEIEDLSLNPFESKFFADSSGTEAAKKRFKIGDLSGSFMLVSTTNWQAHHAPELCLIGNGLTVDTLTPKSLASEVKGRWLSVNNGRANAAYWFQSPRRTTDDFLDRFWSDVSRQDKSWTLISILFDRPVSSDAPEVKTLVNGLHESVAVIQ